MPPRLHEQLGYAYDAAWNLNWRTNNQLKQQFNVDNRNQLTTAARTGTLTVAGVTGERKASWEGDYGVTNVNVVGTGLASGPAQVYEDGSWARQGAAPASGNNTYIAVGRDSYGRQSTDSVVVYTPATVTFSYDLNGNLLSDGLRIFEYDDENQLVSVTVSNQYRSVFAYDGKMRRRVRVECSWNGSGWVTNEVVHYVYDGNLVLQERHYKNPHIPGLLPELVTYTRGLDLSGSLQGAGGIGGLLARSDSLSSVALGAGGSTAFYHSDGNGNVTALVGAGNQMLAKYIYDPYGNILAAAGPLADANLYRFSSKEWHASSGLVYYLYRFYEPTLQRWLNRDPIGEKAGPNTQVFIHNHPLTRLDAWGLQVWKCTRVSDLGFGRHAYLWDDRPGPRINSCGMGGVNGNGPTSDTDDKGPPFIEPSVSGPLGPVLPIVVPWQSGSTTCLPVAGSSGSEDSIMGHCRECVNSKISWYSYAPPLNDCHNACDSVLGDLGFAGPPMDKLNKWETDALISIQF